MDISAASLFMRIWEANAVAKRKRLFQLVSEP